MMDQKLWDLRDTVVRNFGAENVVSMLVHGSIIFNGGTASHDLDLVIVLKERTAGDCDLLRTSVMEAQIDETPIQLHLIYLAEVPVHADFFSIHTCGPFFVWHLRQSVVLHGENIFDRINGPSDYHLQLSLLQKVQQYTFQLRNMVFKRHASEWDLHQARKRSIVVLKDLLMSEGELFQREEDIVREGLSKFTEFSEDERRFLHSLVVAKGALSPPQPQRLFLHNCLAIHERAYTIMRGLVVAKTRCKFLL